MRKPKTEKLLILFHTFGTSCIEYTLTPESSTNVVYFIEQTAFSVVPKHKEDTVNASKDEEISKFTHTGYGADLMRNIYKRIK